MGKRKSFAIADTHFGHENIIRLSHRPFASVREMNETLIENWNSVASDGDDIYHVGDFFYRCGKEDIIDILYRLKGNIHLIKGGHDDYMLRIPEARKRFTEICDIKTLKENGRQIVLCHYPLAEWEGYFRGAYHFYGHIHNNHGNLANQYMESLPNAFNVGVDLTDYKLLTFDEIINTKVK